MGKFTIDTRFAEEPIMHAYNIEMVTDCSERAKLIHENPVIIFMVLDHKHLCPYQIAIYTTLLFVY